MSAAVRKGEVWDIATGENGRTRRLLIVSADEWHSAASPQAIAILRRHGMAEILPFSIVLHEQADSVAGVAFMTTLMPVDPADLVEQIGSVGGLTLSKVDHSLRKVYAL